MRRCRCAWQDGTDRASSQTLDCVPTKDLSMNLTLECEQETDGRWLA